MCLRGLQIPDGDTEESIIRGLLKTTKQGTVVSNHWSCSTEFGSLAVSSGHNPPDNHVTSGLIVQQDSL